MLRARLTDLTDFPYAGVDRAHARTRARRVVTKNPSNRQCARKDAQLLKNELTDRFLDPSENRSIRQSLMIAVRH